MAGELAELKALVEADTSSFMRGMDSVDRRMGRTQQGMSRMGRAAGALGRAGAVGAVALGGGMLLAGGFIAKAGLDMAMLKQRSQIAFTTMLGSGKKATAMLNDLQKFAATTPFEFKELIPASQKLLAMGFAAKDVIPMLTDIGDAAAGLGLGTEGVNRITLALGQMQAKGKVAGGEMMQLTEAGIPAWKYLAEATGKSTAEVMKMSEKGLLPAGMAIKAIRQGMRGDFGGLMAKQSKTLSGQMSNLADTFNNVAGNIMGQFVPGLTKAAERMNAWLSGDDGKAFLQGLVDGAGAVANAIGVAVGFIVTHWDQIKAVGMAAFAAVGSAATVLAGILTGTIIPAVQSAFGFLQDHQATAEAVAGAILAMAAAFTVFNAVTTAVRTTMMALNIVMAMNPFVLVAAAVIGLVAAIVILWRRNEAFRAAVTSAWNAIKGAVSSAVGAVRSAVSGVAGAFSSLQGKVSSAVGAVLGVLGGLAGKVLSAIKTAFTIYWTPYSKMLEIGKKVVSGVLDGMKGLGGKVWSAIRSAFASISGSISFPTPSISIGHRKVGVGPLAVDVPYPTGISFATGTMTTGPQMALIGEKGREYVIPVTGANRQNGMRLWRQAGRDLGVPGMATGGWAGAGTRPPGDPTRPPGWGAGGWSKSYLRHATLAGLQQIESDYEANTQRWQSYLGRDPAGLTQNDRNLLADRTNMASRMLQMMVSQRSIIGFDTKAARTLRSLRRKYARMTKKQRASKAGKALKERIDRYSGIVSGARGSFSVHDAQQSILDMAQAESDLRTPEATTSGPPDTPDTGGGDTGGGGLGFDSGVGDGGGGGGGGVSGGGGSGATLTYITIDMRGAVVTVDDFVAQVREKLAAYGKVNGSIFGNVQADTVPR